MIANGLLAHARLSATACGCWVTYLFFSLPRGMTAVTGGMGRSEPPLSLGSEVSFLGFFAILLLRCSPLAMVPPVKVSEWDRAGMVRHKPAPFSVWRAAPQRGSLPQDALAEPSAGHAPAPGRLTPPCPPPPQPGHSPERRPAGRAGEVTGHVHRVDARTGRGVQPVDHVLIADVHALQRQVHHQHAHYKPHQAGR